MMTNEEQKAWDMYVEQAANRLLPICDLTDKQWHEFVAIQISKYADAMMEQRKARMR